MQQHCRIKLGNFISPPETQLWSFCLCRGHSILVYFSETSHVTVISLDVLYGAHSRLYRDTKCFLNPLIRRAVVLESRLETFFYRLGLVLDSLVFGLGLVSDLVIGLAKCSSWSRPSPAIYAFFFSFKTKPLIWLACSANG